MVVKQRNGDPSQVVLAFRPRPARSAATGREQKSEEEHNRDEKPENGREGSHERRSSAKSKVVGEKERHENRASAEKRLESRLPGPYFPSSIINIARTSSSASEFGNVRSDPSAIVECAPPRS